MAAPKGNQNGKRGKIFRDAMIYSLKSYDEKHKKVPRKGAIYRLCETLINQGIHNKSIEAVKTIADRIEGRVSIQLDNDEPNIQISGIRREIIVIDRQASPQNQPIEGELEYETLPKPADNAVQKG